MSDMNQAAPEDEPLFEEPTTTRKKRKYRRRVAPAKYAAKVAAKAESKPDQQSDDELFFGYRPPHQCPNACVEAAATGKPCCWVTQEDRCILSGLQSRDQVNPQNLARYNRLQRWAAIQKAKG